MTISVHHLGTEGNKSKIVSVMGYIGTKALHINPMARLVVK